MKWMSKQKRTRGRQKKNWMEGIKKAMDEINLNEGQWEDRKQWSLGVGQRRKTFWNRYIQTLKQPPSLHYTPVIPLTCAPCTDSRLGMRRTGQYSWSAPCPRRGKHPQGTSLSNTPITEPSLTKNSYFKHRKSRAGQRQCAKQIFRYNTPFKANLSHIFRCVYMKGWGRVA